MDRPSVDVVIPFVGSDDELNRLVARATELDLQQSDTITVVDNRAAASETERHPNARTTILGAPRLASSYFARNCGAGRGQNDWIVFFDADVEPRPDLVDRYFEPRPHERTAVLAGAVIDTPLGESNGSLAARYAHLRASMSQANTLREGPWSYAQTANCAVRRRAFEAVGVFPERVRSGADADLCFRLRRAGWELERRDQACAVHRSRRQLRAMLGQRARHGSGAAWLDRRYPGSFPKEHWLGITVWTLRSGVRAAHAALHGDTDAAVVAAVDPLSTWAFELGRLIPNRAPARRKARA